MNAAVLLGIAGLVAFAIRSSLVHTMHGRVVGHRMSRVVTAGVVAGLAASATSAWVSRLGEHGVARAAAVVVTLTLARRTGGLVVPMVAGMLVCILAAVAGA